MQEYTKHAAFVIIGIVITILFTEVKGFVKESFRPNIEINYDYVEIGSPRVLISNLFSDTDNIHFPQIKKHLKDTIAKDDISLWYYVNNDEDSIFQRHQNNKEIADTKIYTDLKYSSSTKFIKLNISNETNKKSGKIEINFNDSVFFLEGKTGKLINSSTYVVSDIFPDKDIDIYIIDTNRNIGIWGELELTALHNNEQITEIHKITPELDIYPFYFANPISNPVLHYILTMIGAIFIVVLIVALINAIPFVRRITVSEADFKNAKKTIEIYQEKLSLSENNK